MIIPVIPFGNTTLRKKSKEINKDYPELQKLIADMRKTMYNSYGVGISAPQVGKNIRIFIVDTSPFSKEKEYSDKEKTLLKAFNKVFINPVIKKEEGELWCFSEGCLSIPGIHEDVVRHSIIHIEYYDENFKKHSEIVSGIPARVILHEYDHLEGILFTDRLSPLKKRLLKRKLEKISKGLIEVDYPMLFG